MNDLKLVIYHPSLDLISDRTIRFLLKKTSSLAREIQAHEVFYLINTSQLDASEKQSIRDRIRRDLNHIPAYYVEKIEKGSIELTITVTAFALWLLQTTVGQSLADAWKTTNFHKHLVKYLSRDLRRKTIETNVESAVNNWQIDRFIVERVRKEIDDDGNIVVTVFLSTPQPLEEKIKLEERKIDVNFIIQNSKKIVKDIGTKKLKKSRKRK